MRFMALLKGLVKTLEYITAAALGEERRREKKMAYKKLSQHSLLKDDNQHPWQIMKTGYYSKHHHGWGKEIYVDNKALFRVEFVNLSLMNNFSVH